MGQRLSPEQVGALAKVMVVIQKAAPAADQVITYGVVGFRFENRSLVAVGGSRRHCSFYVMSTDVMREFSEELDALGLRYSKGTIQFKPENPPPDGLLARIVMARVAQNRAPSALSKARARAPRTDKGRQSRRAAIAFLLFGRHELCLTTTFSCSPA